MTNTSNTSNLDVMEYDVVIVGAGPSGLASAIALKQLNPEYNVCILEKGAEVGSHILSGAVFDPKSLDELIPNWKELKSPIQTSVTQDEFWFLTQDKKYNIPHWLLPQSLNNDGCYVISLNDVVRWLGTYAENLGIEIYAGYAASEIVYDEKGGVSGVLAGVMGIDKQGNPTSQHQAGMHLKAHYTLFAEGARGHLGKQLMNHFKLQENHSSYAIGLKEVWEIPQEQFESGKVIHSLGFPLSFDTYGGGFLYHYDENKISLGMVVGLNYKNPYLSPFEELQRYKTHPEIAKILQNGRRIGYGARAINASGLQSLPILHFNGGLLLGCDAGFLNAARIKGSHTAIKSGMLAAQAVHEALSKAQYGHSLSRYAELFQNSWLYTELYQARNFKPWVSKGIGFGMVMAGVEQKLFQGKVPWTLKHKKSDHQYLEPSSKHQPINYPKPDNKLTFDKLSSVYLTNTNHEENQPCHLKLKDTNSPYKINWLMYQGPETRYCPAGVYEYVQDVLDNTKKQLQINAQNCIHCKTCDIKDPTQNINWVTPEGGGGPQYSGM